MNALNTLDWVIIVTYLIGMIGLSFALGRGQKDFKDYYLAGHTNRALPIALSTMATQCSTNSLLGAPAFVAFSIGGGLIWLQYEIAVPFAMIGLMVVIMPILRRLNLVSLYEYLELRFGVGTRSVLSLIFQFLRAFSTGVTVYGISLVLMVCLDIPFWGAVLLLGGVTVVYDVLGGMKAVIYSDVIQLILLVSAIIIAIYVAIDLLGGFSNAVAQFDRERLQAVDFQHHGLGDGKDFAFWPMLFGGFFLYLSYYGCDQTQAQRELSTRNVNDTNYALFLGGLLRFPLVFTYCVLGVCIGAYATAHPEFLEFLPKRETLIEGNLQEEPNYNLAVPIFVLQHFPHGLIGLVMVGLFAAAMSSLDSTLNSLSAVSMRDFVQRFFLRNLSQKGELLVAKIITVFWGVLCLVFAFYVGDISDSIIVSVNKISSLISGPLLAVFLLGMLTRRANGTGAVSGLIIGFSGNLLLWRYVPALSWLWWNVFGFFVAYGCGYLISLMKPAPGFDKLKSTLYQPGHKKNDMRDNWMPYYLILAFFGIGLFISLACL